MNRTQYDSFLISSNGETQNPDLSGTGKPTTLISTVVPRFGSRTPKQALDDLDCCQSESSPFLYSCSNPAHKMRIDLITDDRASTSRLTCTQSIPWFVQISKIRRAWEISHDRWPLHAWSSRNQWHSLIPLIEGEGGEKLRTQWKP